MITAAEARMLETRIDREVVLAHNQAAAAHFCANLEKTIRQAISVGGTRTVLYVPHTTYGVEAYAPETVKELVRKTLLEKGFTVDKYDGITWDIPPPPESQNPTSKKRWWTCV